MAVALAACAVLAYRGAWHRRTARKLEESLRKMTSMRDSERLGRTTAERELRSGLQATAAAQGYVCPGVGVVRSPFGDRRGTPRQGTVAPDTEGILLFNTDIPNAALDALDGFSHVWVIFIFHENTNIRKHTKKTTNQSPKQQQQQQRYSTFPAKVVPPRLGKRVGVFSTRSPHRPNPIGLTVCRIKAVNVQQGYVWISGMDLVDGTPVCTCTWHIHTFSEGPPCIPVHPLALPTPPCFCFALLHLSTHRSSISSHTSPTMWCRTAWFLSGCCPRQQEGAQTRMMPRRPMPHNPRMSGRVVGARGAWTSRWGSP